MNKINKHLTEKAIKAWNLEHFGCEKVETFKASDIQTKKPVTIFFLHHDWGTLMQVREHESVAYQNIEWNGNFEKRSKFIKDFKAKEKKAYKARKAEREAKKNSIGNMFPKLAGLR